MSQERAEAELSDQRRAAESSQTLVTIPQSKLDELLQQAEMLNALTDTSIEQRETIEALSAELKSVMEELEVLKSKNSKAKQVKPQVVC